MAVSLVVAQQPLASQQASSQKHGPPVSHAQPRASHRQSSQPQSVQHEQHDVDVEEVSDKDAESELTLEVASAVTADTATATSSIIVFME